MVISVDIDRFTIRKTLVDQGSSIDILYWKTFKAMRIPEAEMVPYDNCRDIVCGSVIISTKR